MYHYVGIIKYLLSNPSEGAVRPKLIMTLPVLEKWPETLEVPSGHWQP